MLFITMSLSLKQLGSFWGETKAEKICPVQIANTRELHLPLASLYDKDLLETSSSSDVADRNTFPLLSPPTASTRSSPTPILRIPRQNHSPGTPTT